MTSQRPSRSGLAPGEHSPTAFDDRFASVLDAAPDALVCVEPSGRIAAVNHQVGEMFGYRRDDLLGAEIEVLLPEALRARHVQHRAAFNARPQVRSMGSGMKLVARRRDGTTLPVEVSLVPWLAGAPGWVIAAIRDVTQQQALQAANAESEARLRQIAESVNLVFILMQLEPPAYLYVSSGARRLIGVDAGTRDDADLARALEVVYPEDRERVGTGFLEDARAGRPAQSEHRLFTDDGQVIWVHATATPVPAPSGPPQRTVVTLEDVTERVSAVQKLREAEAAARAAERAARTAEASARAANESKNQFLSRMSHELRTPLNAVLGFGQLLARQLAGTEHAESVQFVLKGGQHLLELINDVLDISRIESGKMSLSLERIALAALVEETLQLMGPLAAASEVTLAEANGDPHVQLFADRQRVRQILLNLLSNAVKYNRAGGRVWVSWAVQDAMVMISVRDEGPGIAPELQDRLFAPFDRLGAEGSDVEGAGIGLALTRSLAELMNGAVTVNSTRGHGATFTLTLPLGTPTGEHTPTRAQPHPLPGPAPANQVGLGGRTLLYIEDNEPNVHVVEHLLKLRPGWSMVHAGLGTLGLQLARANQPDLILLDLHLPDQSGRDILRTLKRRADTSDIPVAVLTADASPGLETKLTHDGAHRFLTKPLDFDAVLTLLDEVARRHPRSGHTGPEPKELP